MNKIKIKSTYLKFKYSLILPTKIIPKKLDIDITEFSKNERTQIFHYYKLLILLLINNLIK